MYREVDVVVESIAQSESSGRRLVSVQQTEDVVLTAGATLQHNTHGNKER